MNHKLFITRLIDFISANQGSILIDEYQVNGVRHSKAEFGGIVGDLEAKVVLGATESSVEFVKAQPRFRDWQNNIPGSSVVRVKATRDFVRIRTDKDGSDLLNYRELNYTDEGGFRSTMPWETAEEFQSRCDRINVGLGLVPA